MADLKFYDVIERPVITENSMSVLDEKQQRLRLKMLLKKCSKALR